MEKPKILPAQFDSVDSNQNQNGNPPADREASCADLSLTPKCAPLTRSGLHSQSMEERL
jgi:hypothetical protein